MKKVLCMIFALVMMLAMPISQVAFAAELEDSETSVATEEIQPKGTLSGYGAAWVTPNSPIYNGSFTVEVTGMSWINAHLTLGIENFSDDVCVRAYVYSPSGVCVYDPLSYSGGYFTMSNPGIENISFSPGSTGTYTVKYDIWTWDGTIPSSGRVMCWIY